LQPIVTADRRNLGPVLERLLPRRPVQIVESFGPSPRERRLRGGDDKGSAISTKPPSFTVPAEPKYNENCVFCVNRGVKRAKQLALLQGVARKIRYLPKQLNFSREQRIFDAVTTE
jgi:hypothetical protein